MRKPLVLALTGVLAFSAAGCASWRSPSSWFASAKPTEGAPDTSRGVTEVRSAELSDFFSYAYGFYSRLPQRRFNDRNTFKDPKLGGYFRTESAYADYYANMTGALRYARFKRLRPLSVEIVEVRAEGPGKAVVKVRFVGADSRPLRWTDVDLEREDKWERVGERWWISPGRV